MVTIVVLAAYLIGSVPFAVILARHWGHLDVRRVGSGNPGAANVVRAFGMKPGLLVAALDAAKGAASVVLATRLDGGTATPAIAGVAAIVGHIFPVWVGFRGGKGVATACGVFWVLAPLAAAPALAIFTISVWLTRYVSLGSMLASAALPPLAWAVGSSSATVAAGATAAALIMFRHRANLDRLCRGTERRFRARRILDR